MRKLLLIITIISTIPAHSQTVEILSKSAVKNLNEGKKFAFIEPATDTAFLQFVATIQARVKDKNKKPVLESLFAEIRKQANKLGATCYKIKSYERGGSTDEAILTLDCYFAWDATLVTNASYHEKNVIYIFAMEKENEGRKLTVHINDNSREIKPGTYIRYVMKKGEEVKLSKGEISGETIWLKWEENKQPAFFTLTGFGLSDPRNHPPAYPDSEAIVDFKTGGINRVTDLNLGLLLVQLLKQGDQ